MTTPMGFWRAAGALALAVSFAVGGGATAQARSAPHDTLVPFQSDEELLRYLKKVQRARPRMEMDGVASMPEPAPPPPPPAPASAEKSASQPGQSITNTQEA